MKIRTLTTTGVELRIPCADNEAVRLLAIEMSVSGGAVIDSVIIIVAAAGFGEGVVARIQSPAIDVGATRLSMVMDGPVVSVAGLELCSGTLPDIAWPMPLFLSFTGDDSIGVDSTTVLYEVLTKSP